MQSFSSHLRSRYVLKGPETEARRCRKPHGFPELSIFPIQDQKSGQSRPSTILIFDKVEDPLRRLHEVIKGRVFPHFAVMFQWALLVMIITLNLNFSIAVTGAVANGGLKLVLVFHLWMLFVPAALCIMFYRTRKVGMPEKCIVFLSIAILLLSIANIYLHFVDESLSLMKLTEVIAWTLYNGMFSVSVYTVSTRILLPALARAGEIETETAREDKKSWI